MKTADTDLDAVDDIVAAFDLNGYTLSDNTELSTLDLSDHWRMRDGDKVYDIQSNGAAQLFVTVADVISIDVDTLGGGATISDALNLIKTETSNDVDFNVITEQDIDPDSATNFVTGFSLDYGAMPGGAAPIFAIQPVFSEIGGEIVGSPAAGDLGVAGEDTGGDGSIFGSLNTRNLADRFFITEDSGISISGGLIKGAPF